MTYRLRAGLATLVFWSAIGSAAQALDGRDYVGNFAFSGGAAETTARNEAFKAATDSLNPVFRVVAKPFLESATKIPKTIKIVMQGKDIGIQIDPYPMRVSGLDSTPFRFKGTIGQESTMTRHWEGATIVEMTQSSSGSRGNTYRLSGDGKSMTVVTTFQSGQLKAPLRYSLTYRRN
ncbi:MAG: hypothetical protein H7338_25175 [Candidatus Sericytochromatia bacterium]|nr:hypothetical protein [Candidatus Sericytochromatia bacterium]